MAKILASKQVNGFMMGPAEGSTTELVRIVDTIGNLRPSTRSLLEKLVQYDRALFNAELLPALERNPMPCSPLSRTEIVQALLQDLSNERKIILPLPTTPLRETSGNEISAGAPLELGNICRKTTVALNQILANLLEPTNIAAASPIALAGNSANSSTRARNTSSIFNQLNWLAVVMSGLVGVGYFIMSLNALDLLPLSGLNMAALMIVITLVLIPAFISGYANFLLIHDATGKLVDVKNAIEKYDSGFFVRLFNRRSPWFAAKISASLIVVALGFWLSLIGGALLAQTFSSGVDSLSGVVHQDALFNNTQFMRTVRGTAFTLEVIGGIFLMKTLLMLGLSKIWGIMHRIFGSDSYRSESNSAAIGVILAGLITYLIADGVENNALSAITNFDPIRFTEHAAELVIKAKILAAINLLARFINVSSGFRVLLETGWPTRKGLGIGLLALLSATGGAMQAVAKRSNFLALLAAILASMITNLPLMRIYLGLKAEVNDREVYFEEWRQLARLFNAFADLVEKCNAAPNKNVVAQNIRALATYFEFLIEKKEQVIKAREERNNSSPGANPFWCCRRRATPPVGYLPLPERASAINSGGAVAPSEV